MGHNADRVYIKCPLCHQDVRRRNYLKHIERVHPAIIEREDVEPIQSRV